MNEVHFLGIFSTKCRRLKGEMIMASEKDIENLMKMLDGKVEAGTSRINVTATDVR